MLKVRDTSKISPEGLKKNIIKIYKIEKPIYFNNSKKETQFFKKMTYSRKHIKMNKFTAKRAWACGGKVNISI